MSARGRAGGGSEGKSAGEERDCRSSGNREDGDGSKLRGIFAYLLFADSRPFACTSEQRKWATALYFLPFALRRHIPFSPSPVPLSAVARGKREQ